MNGFQSTGIPDAPDDGNAYSRFNKTWNKNSLGFIATKSSDQNITNGVQSTLIDFTLSFDSTNGAFNSTNGIFTAPLSGIYSCSVNLVTGVVAWVTSGSMDVIIKSNNTQINRRILVCQTAFSGNVGGGLNAFVYLSQGDRLTFNVISNGQSVTILGNANHDFFQCFFVPSFGGFDNSVQSPAMQSQSIESIATPQSTSFMTKLKSLVGLS